MLAWTYIHKYVCTYNVMLLVLVVDRQTETIFALYVQPSSSQIYNRKNGKKRDTTTHETIRRMPRYEKNPSSQQTSSVHKATKGGTVQ